MKHENTIPRNRIEQNNMTQQQLADYVGVSKRTIQSIESGESLPPVPLALKISSVFGKSIEEVFILSDD